ncbi:MAG: riboflavin synthase [Kangiellaceae bacterium]|jgi:riboflavin synthase
MFTGIIESIGTISKIEYRAGDARLTIEVGELDMSDVALGDSIACNGVCLTAIEFDQYRYTADVSGETLRLTTMANIQIGSAVNLEKALMPTSRLGGHLVSGHVDGIGEVLSVSKDSRSVQFNIKAPDEIAHYIAKKGSICVDGVSLTVNEVDGSTFQLNLVPHTLAETTAINYLAGTKVNLEVDLLARYLERLLTGQKTQSKANITTSLLQQSGFIK